MTTSLATLSRAKEQLATAKNLTDILEIRDKAQAIQIYVKAIGESLEAQNHAAEIKLRAERAAGEMLAGMEKAKPGPKKDRSQVGTELSGLGINKNQSSRWQKEASVPEEEFEGWIAAANEAGSELTQSGLLKLAKAAHVSQSVGENEWYTPAQYIEAARETMGIIDLDPASNEVAQATVQAQTYYTIADDGLEQSWRGNVWLNPPYSKDLIDRFVSKLVQACADGKVRQAILLVNNATETRWLQKALQTADGICFPKGRISFESPKRDETNSPLQGQVFLYWGQSGERFSEAFKRFGVVWA